MELLKLSHVSKAFGKNKVLEDLSFSVTEHSVFGFIGRNGAGKTTAMKMILGLLRPDQGEILVNGQRTEFGQNRISQSIGYLPDVPEFYDYMTPMEYLLLCGACAGVPKEESRIRAKQLLELVGLAEADKRIHGFSRGMKQRLGIAQALLNRPRLLICDEPTSALDPAGRKEILDILSSVRTETTVLFSTHILSDVERICDKIAFLHNGRIALGGTLEEMKNVRKGNGLEIEFLKPEEAEQFLTWYPGGTCVGGGKLLFEQKTEKDMAEMMQVLWNNQWLVRKIELLEPALEDLFMEVVDHEAAKSIYE